MSSTWIRRLALVGLLLCLVVVVLGAYVRLTDAGLGCPDWPGCYGHLTPVGAQANPAAQAAFAHVPLDVGKAWREMIHRYAASTLGLIIVAIAAIAIATRRRRNPGIVLSLALVAIVVFQGALGMLTVTWQLKPLIVTAHLLFGMATLGMMAWLWMSVQSHDWPGATAARSAATVTARRLALLGLVALGLQIALGGWTSSNYAAVACPDLPTCQGRWWPQADYGDAFVLWRGLGVNYEGGVLDNPARVAIHFAHRLGALLASLALIAAAVLVLRHAALRRARPAAIAMLAALALQILIAVSMILAAFPLWLATAHNAGAALLVLAAVALVHRTCVMDAITAR